MDRVEWAAAAGKALKAILLPVRANRRENGPAVRDWNLLLTPSAGSTTNKAADLEHGRRLLREADDAIGATNRVAARENLVNA